MRRFTAFLKDIRGLAFIEFIVAAPIFIIIIFAGFEIGRYMMILQKVDKSAYTLGDMISQAVPASNPVGDGMLTVAELQDIMSYFERVMNPHDVEEKGMVIITSLFKRDDTAAIRVQWQMAGGGGMYGGDVSSEMNGMPAASINNSVKGSIAGFNPSINEAINVNGGIFGGENFIAVEIFYLYEPIFQSIFGWTGLEFVEETLLKRSAFFRPRMGDLLYLPPDYPAP